MQNNQDVILLKCKIEDLIMKEFEGILQHNQYIKNIDAVVGLLRTKHKKRFSFFICHICNTHIITS